LEGSAVGPGAKPTYLSEVFGSLSVTGGVLRLPSGVLRVPNSNPDGAEVTVGANGIIDGSDDEIPTYATVTGAGQIDNGGRILLPTANVDVDVFGRHYEVSFDLGGGSIDSESAAVQVTVFADTFANGNRDFPTEPTRSGFTFDEWNTAADGTGAEFTDEYVLVGASSNGGPVTITAYAQWEGGGGADTTPPSVTTFALQTASDTGAADDDGVTNTAVYDLVFDESVTGLTSADFTVTGTSTRCSVGTAGSEATYTVTLSDCTSGTVTLTLNADSVSDGTNDGPTADVSAEGVTIDRTAPTVTSFAGNVIAGYTITFREPVTGLTTDDFTRSGRLLGSCAVSSASGTGGFLVVNSIEFYQSWTVQVTDCPTSLTLILKTQSVDDVAGNSGPPKVVRARTTKT
jgi:uncharacterized repeat protein (TIGR02543 family)